MQVAMLLRDFKFSLHIVEKHHAFYSSYDEVSFQRRIITHSHRDLQLVLIPPFKLRSPTPPTVLIMFPHLLECDLIIIPDHPMKHCDHQPALLPVHAFSDCPTIDDSH